MISWMSKLKQGKTEITMHELWPEHVNKMQNQQDSLAGCIFMQSIVHYHGKGSRFVLLDVVCMIVVAYFKGNI